MFKDLMHNMLGGSISAANTLGIANAAQGSIVPGGGLTQAQYANKIFKPEKISNTKKIFNGNIEVLQVSNGYVVNIGTREGYEYTTHIAETITDVNAIIAAAMVAFQLEGK